MTLPAGLKKTLSTLLIAGLLLEPASACVVQLSPSPHSFHSEVFHKEALQSWLVGGYARVSGYRRPETHVRHLRGALRESRSFFVLLITGIALAFNSQTHASPPSPHPSKVHSALTSEALLKTIGDTQLESSDRLDALSKAYRKGPAAIAALRKNPALIADFLCQARGDPGIILTDHDYDQFLTLLESQDGVKVLISFLSDQDISRRLFALEVLRDWHHGLAPQELRRLGDPLGVHLLRTLLTDETHRLQESPWKLYHSDVFWINEDPLLSPLVNRLSHTTFGTRSAYLLALSGEDLSQPTFQKDQELRNAILDILDQTVYESEGHLTDPSAIDLSGELRIRQALTNLNRAVNTVTRDKPEGELYTLLIRGAIAEIHQQQSSSMISTAELLGFLRYPDRRVQLSAIIQLGRRREPRAIPPLLSILKASALHKTAAEALISILKVHATTEGLDGLVDYAAEHPQTPVLEELTYAPEVPAPLLDRLTTYSTQTDSRRYDTLAKAISSHRPEAFKIWEHSIQGQQVKQKIETIHRREKQQFNRLLIGFLGTFIALLLELFAAFRWRRQIKEKSKSFMRLLQRHISWLNPPLADHSWAAEVVRSLGAGQRMNVISIETKRPSDEIYFAKHESSWNMTVLYPDESSATEAQRAIKSTGFEERVRIISGNVLQTLRLFYSTPQDIAYVPLFLEDLSPDEANGLLFAAVSVLRPGGKIVITVRTLSSLKAGDSLAEIRQTFQTMGLHIDHLYENDEFLGLQRGYQTRVTVVATKAEDFYALRPDRGQILLSFLLSTGLLIIGLPVLFSFAATPEVWSAFLASIKFGLAGASLLMTVLPSNDEAKRTPALLLSVFEEWISQEPSYKTTPVGFLLLVRKRQGTNLNAVRSALDTLYELGVLSRMREKGSWIYALAPWLKQSLEKDSTLGSALLDHIASGGFSGLNLSPKRISPEDKLGSMKELSSFIDRHEQTLDDKETSATALAQLSEVKTAYGYSSWSALVERTLKDDNFFAMGSQNRVFLIPGIPGFLLRAPLYNRPSQVDSQQTGDLIPILIDSLPSLGMPFAILGDVEIMRQRTGEVLSNFHDPEQMNNAYERYLQTMAALPLSAYIGMARDIHRANIKGYIVDTRPSNVLTVTESVQEALHVVDWVYGNQKDNLLALVIPLTGRGFDSLYSGSNENMPGWRLQIIAKSAMAARIAGLAAMGHHLSFFRTILAATQEPTNVTPEALNNWVQGESDSSLSALMYEWTNGRFPSPTQVLPSKDEDLLKAA